MQQKINVDFCFAIWIKVKNHMETAGLLTQNNIWVPFVLFLEQILKNYSRCKWVNAHELGAHIPLARDVLDWDNGELNRK